MLLAVFVATYFVLSVYIQMSMRALETNLATGVGLSVMLVTAIASFYALARAVTLHRSLHLAESVSWIFIDRLFIPLVTWYLHIRHVGVKVETAFTSPWMVVLLLLLFDPIGAFRKSIRTTIIMKDGHFGGRPSETTSPRTKGKGSASIIPC